MDPEFLISLHVFTHQSELTVDISVAAESIEYIISRTEIFNTM